MSIVLGFETDFNRALLVINFNYQPSRLLVAIAALILALLGLAVDPVINSMFPALPAGLVALWFATAALGLAGRLMLAEVQNAFE